MVNANRLLDRDGRVTVTTDEPISVDRAALAAIMGLPGARRRGGEGATRVAPSRAGLWVDDVTSEVG
jgi:hypothetical protein